MRMFDDDGGSWGVQSEVGARRRHPLLISIALLLLTAQCAPAIKRDYSSIPAGRVGFDDMCGLQTYFDRLAMKIGNPPAVVSSTEVQGKGTRSGLSRFTFETEGQLEAIRQVLTENWKRLPEETKSAPRIDVEVRWSERSGVRRVVTNEDAELTVGRERSTLPYHVCLSELLFGEPLYRQRREALGLGPLPTPTPILTSSPDASPADGGISDGGAAIVDAAGSTRRDGATVSTAH